MNTFNLLINAILVIVALYALAILLRQRGVLKEEHSLILARLVTDVFLPATIFANLAGQKIQWKQITPALVMMALELATIALAWVICVLLKFERAQQGAVVFCAAFGSSAFLGYALINETFPGNAQAMVDAILISEIGVGYTIFILGPILAAYFGHQDDDWRALGSASLGFFKSPVFFALIIGLLWGALGLPGEKDPYLAPIFQVCQTLAAALTPIAVLAIGLMLKIPDIRKILLPLGMVILIKLLLKPFAAGLLATWLDFDQLARDIMVILAAMPPAILGVVFLRRYGGDASLASALLLAATMASAATLLMVFSMVGR